VSRWNNRPWNPAERPEGVEDELCPSDAADWEQYLASQARDSPPEEPGPDETTDDDPGCPYPF
jgi:hypothetical protein